MKVTIIGATIMSISILLGLTDCGNKNSENINEVQITEITTHKTETTSEEQVKAISYKENTKPFIKGINISYDFTHKSTMASNQLAIWVEDESGNIVKTLYVSDFTAARRGYKNRDMSLSAWVKAADPDNMTDTEIDAVSSATPTDGTHTLYWDMIDSSGEKISTGIYKIKVEGTLYWESNVLYTAEIDIENFINGELPLTEVKSMPNSTDNADMLKNIHIETIIENNS